MDWSFLIPGKDNLVTDDDIDTGRQERFIAKTILTGSMMCSAIMRGMNMAQRMDWPVSFAMIIRMLLKISRTSSSDLLFCAVVFNVEQGPCSSSFTQLASSAASQCRLPYVGKRLLCHQSSRQVS